MPSEFNARSLALGFVGGAASSYALWLLLRPPKALPKASSSPAPASDAPPPPPPPPPPPLPEYRPAPIAARASPTAQRPAPPRSPPASYARSPPPSPVKRAALAAREAEEDKNSGPPPNCVLWGSNSDGQCGLGTVPPDLDVSLPVPVPPVGLRAAGRVLSVACGSRHSLLLTEGGEVFAWGWGAIGQLGHGDLESRLAPARVEALSALAARGRVVNVAAGGMHSAAVCSDGALYSWGMDKFGQLGLGAGGGGGSGGARRQSRTSDPHAIPDDNKALPTPTRVSFPPLGTFGGGTPRVAVVACGGMHTAALTDTGVLYCFGRADSGQLGIGYDWVAAAGGDNRPRDLDAAGDVDAGEAGSGAPSSSRIGVSVPTPVTFSGVSPSASPRTAAGAAPKLAHVACGAFHTAAVSTDGAVFAWGKEDFGMLGVSGIAQSSASRRCGGAGQYVPGLAPLPEGAKAARVACGAYHTVVMAEDGAVYACGKGEFGRLGLGDADDANRLKLTMVPLGARAVDVAAGGSHTMVLDRSGAVHACGRGEFGRLGGAEAPAKLGGGSGNGNGHSSVLRPAVRVQGKVAKMAAGGQHCAVVLAE